VLAHEALVIEHFGEELRVDEHEELLVALRGVVVERTDLAHRRTICVVERLVVDVAIGHIVAEARVLLRVQDVRVPERVDGIRDRVAVERIEHSDGVVLLEREDPAVEPVVDNLHAQLEHVGLDLGANGGEVFSIDARKTLQLKRSELAGIDDIDQTGRTRHGGTPCK